MILCIRSTTSEGQKFCTRRTKLYQRTISPHLPHLASRVKGALYHRSTLKLRSGRGDGSPPAARGPCQSPGGTRSRSRSDIDDGAFWLALQQGPLHSDQLQTHCLTTTARSTSHIDSAAQVANRLHMGAHGRSSQLSSWLQLMAAAPPEATLPRSPTFMATLAPQPHHRKCRRQAGSRGQPPWRCGRQRRHCRWVCQRHSRHARLPQTLTGTRDGSPGRPRRPLQSRRASTAPALPKLLRNASCVSPSSACFPAVICRQPCRLFQIRWRPAYTFLTIWLLRWLQARQGHAQQCVASNQCGPV